MLLSVKDARARLLSALSPLDVEIVPLTQALGRVLAEAITSDVDLPPFSNSSMDGFAVRAVDVAPVRAGQKVVLRVIGDIPAGWVPSTALRSGQTMRIMTGAPMPPGADAVVPVEDTDFNVRQAGVEPPEQILVRRAVRPGDYVRPNGEDLRMGEVVFEAGHRLRPQDLGMLATLGLSPVHVTRQPRVALLSTGDELLPVTDPLQPGKIRESNSYTLTAQVERCGGIPLRLGIVPDEVQAVRERLDQAVDHGADLIISSAGVSVGAFDFVREVVETYGQLDFWRVNMRPGKPLAFGVYRQIPFIGLPGNPVSAFVGFEVFVRPALFWMAGEPNWSPPTQRARLLEPITSDGRESYLRGVVAEENGQWTVRLTGHQGSGNLFSLVQANSLVVIPAGVTSLPAGGSVDVWPMFQGYSI